MQSRRLYSLNSFLKNVQVMAFKESELKDFFARCVVKK